MIFFTDVKIFSSQVWGARLFHSSWVVIGSFFVIQLALAVLADSFVQAQEDEKLETEREALHDKAILCPVHGIPAPEPWD